MAVREFSWSCEACDVKWDEAVSFSVVDGEEPARQIPCPACNKQDDVLRLPGGMPARLEIQERTHGGMLKGGKLYTRFDSKNTEGKAQARLEYTATQARARGDVDTAVRAKHELAARKRENKRKG